MNKDLTKGNVTKTMLIFAAPMILGNLLQQCYNIADSMIVGRFLGFAYLLRAMGDSVTPLLFLGAAALLNIGLDLLFIAKFSWGIKGAAVATVIAQVFSGLGIGCYALVREAPARCIVCGDSDKKGKNFTGEVIRFSMAAFAAAVKIDTLAYMPAQEFGNAYSIFISQNHGAGEEERIKKGTKSAIIISVLFCIMISYVVYIMSPRFMQLFVKSTETEIIKIGTGYLRVEGAFYWGIGLLFLLYGYFRGNGKPEVSVVLTVISLGTRVSLAYVLAPLPQIGVYGIWWAIPIGWILADITGVIIMCYSRQVTLRTK